MKREYVRLQNGKNSFKKAHIYPLHFFFPQLLTKSDEDKCPSNLPSGTIHSEEVKPGLDFEFESLYIGNFKWSSTGPVRVSLSIMVTFENI